MRAWRRTIAAASSNDGFNTLQPTSRVWPRVKVECYLRAIRGRRPLREVAEAAGVNHGTLSAIENGRQLPPEKKIAGMELAYGKPVHDWYPRHVLLALTREELPS